MRRTLPILVMLLLPALLLAQQDTKPTAAHPQTPGNPAAAEAKRAPGIRPRIGVALEGGGALGLAHIGVLKWFEEHHIPVDYVAGTSMGGLVGGFYATGMNPEEMKTLIEGLDWRKILSDRTPYEDLSYRRKEDQRAYPNSLIFGLRHGLSAPAGLIPGHQIGLLIDRVALPYYEVPSFDALPVPFRCVATDLVTGKPYIFKDGSLAVALRATMSIPGAFSPVHDGQTVFVDGGLLNNLPTDVVREMGAEIVIAVHLESASVKADDIRSLFNVLEHSVRVVLEENELRSMAQADGVLKHVEERPNVVGFHGCRLQMHGDHNLGAHLADHIRRQVIQQSAVDEYGLPVVHGRERAGNRHRGPQGHCKGAIFKNVGLPGDQVRRHAAERHR